MIGHSGPHSSRQVLRQCVQPRKASYLQHDCLSPAWGHARPSFAGVLGNRESGFTSLFALYRGPTLWVLSREKKHLRLVSGRLGPVLWGSGRRNAGHVCHTYESLWTPVHGDDASCAPGGGHRHSWSGELEAGGTSVLLVLCCALQLSVQFQFRHGCFVVVRMNVESL